MRKEETAIMGNAPIEFISSEGSCADEGRQRQRSRLLLALLAFACLALAIVCAILATGRFATGDTGSYLLPREGMSDEDAQALLNEQVEGSRITVSLSPSMRLADDGSLRVNFIVDEPNNGYSERLEVEQGGHVVYASGAVEPGYHIEWCQAPQARVGSAIATVYALDGEGRDTGNPVSVEVEIVGG